jgi:hypothetical protein
VDPDLGLVALILFMAVALLLFPGGPGSKRGFPAHTVT